MQNDSGTSAKSTGVRPVVFGRSAVVAPGAGSAKDAAAFNPHQTGRQADGAWAPTFLIAHWTPAVLLAAVAIVLMSSHADQWLADRLFAWQGHHWVWRSAVVTEDLIHIVGRDLSTGAWLCVFAAWVVARSRAALAPLRRPLACLLVSTLLATALVAWIKSWSNMDCPWDLTRYGGARDYVGLLALRPMGMPRAACFPAGHASAGYAWLALYFFFLTVRPRWRWAGLATGIALGLLFGITQQLRGAHFMSHDLWTAAICWAAAVGGYLLLGARSGAARASNVRIDQAEVASCEVSAQPPQRNIR